MNAYRQQQLRAAALIEQGATTEQIAAVYGWTARAAPEQIERPKQKRKRKRKLFQIIRRLLE